MNGYHHFRHFGTSQTSADHGLCYQLLYGHYPDSKGIIGSVTIHGLFARYPSNPARTCVRWLQACKPRLRTDFTFSAEPSRVRETI